MEIRRLAAASAFAAVAVTGVAGQQPAPPTAPPTPPVPAAVRPGSGVTNPVLVRQVEPRYPAAAQAARVQGSVELEAVVRVDGRITGVRVTRSLDTTFGLDAEAVRAARDWVFKPGSRDGTPVPVIVTLILEFKLGPRSAEQQSFDNAIADDAPGLVKPVLLRMVPAKFTSAAIKARIQGVVEIDLVVETNGTVGAARIVKSLDPTFGLDEAALQGVHGWTFRPGMLNGQPVPVLTRVAVSFKVD